MNYVVLDLEWNRPCGREAQSPAEHAPVQEIVEIGAVKLNDVFEEIDHLRIFVMPLYYPRMHRQVASLTGVYDSLLRKYGIPFPDACRQFLDWCGDDFMFLTWSDSDIPALAENMRAHGMTLPERLPDTADLQRIFGQEILRSNRCCSLEEAMEILREKGDRAHDALNDARNTVRVCGHMDLDACLDAYITHHYYPAELPASYGNPTEILLDEAAATFVCPWCGGVMKSEGWVPGKKNHLSYAVCGEGDDYLVRLSWCRTPEGRYRARRAMLDMNDDLWDRYCARKEKYALKHPGPPRASA